MPIHQQFSLKKHNTFGFDVSAQYYANPKTIEEILDIFSDEHWRSTPILIIGKGSNILFRSNFEGLVIHPSIQGVELVSEDTNYVYLRVGAGVTWDDFVAYSVKQGWGGIENLSLIPGSVGAAPIQNIGAYGVEVKDCIYQVEAFDYQQMRFLSFPNQECAFGYRNSIFKQELKGRIIITHVTFRLQKQPLFSTRYTDVEEELAKYTDINLQNIREAIIAIRRRKLPDHFVTGNAGSFFKNPIVPSSLANSIKQQYGNIKIFPEDSDNVKIPAAWLIEQCGWKGKRVGNVGVHTNQALVLINHGNGTGQEVLQLAKAIQESVFNTFSIHLEMEVNVV